MSDSRTRVTIHVAEGRKIGIVINPSKHPITENAMKRKRKALKNAMIAKKLVFLILLQLKSGVCVCINLIIATISTTF